MYSEPTEMPHKPVWGFRTQSGDDTKQTRLQNEPIGMRKATSEATGSRGVSLPTDMYKVTNNNNNNNNNNKETF